MRRIMRTPLGAGAVIILALVLLLAVFGPIIWGPSSEVMDTSAALTGPTSKHWIGTDHLGRDLLLRTLVGTRLTIVLALTATAVAVILGLVLGSGPMLLGRRAGRLVIAAVNVAVAFPGLLLALFFAVIFGVGEVGAVLAIGFAGAPTMGRLTQTLVAGVTKRDFVAAARIAGVGRWRILFRHVLPNIAEPLVVQATIGAGGALLSFAGLSFLGLGVQSPAYDWGRLMNEGLNRIYVNPYAALAPGLAVVIAGLAFNLTGEAIAAAFRINTNGMGRSSVAAAGKTAANVRSIGAVKAGAAGLAPDPAAVLAVTDLQVTFPGGSHPVRGVSLVVSQGEAVGLVGESGAGKSLTGLAIAQLIEPPGQVDGRISFLGTDLTQGGNYRQLLGTSMALIFQDPMSSFNPVRRIGEQLAEVARVHQGMARKPALARAVDRLGAVRIADPARRARLHPHEFSGGMSQRAMIGLGLMAQPALIIADEPTTALDVTVQRQVLDLFDSIRTADQVALILISHDVLLVSERCDRILVMYAGKIVEELAADALNQARHPYTRLLVAAVPDLTTDLDNPLAVIPGRQTEPTADYLGCAFAERCPLADQRCRDAEPPLNVVTKTGTVACWHPEQSFDSAPDDDVPAKPVTNSQGIFSVHRPRTPGPWNRW